MTFWKKLLGLPEKSDNYKSTLSMSEQVELATLRESYKALNDIMKLLKIAKIEIKKDQKTGDMYYVLRRSDVVAIKWYNVFWALRRIKESESIFKPTLPKTEPIKTHEIKDVKY